MAAVVGRGVNRSSPTTPSPACTAWPTACPEPPTTRPTDALMPVPPTARPLSMTPAPRRPSPNSYATDDPTPGHHDNRRRLNITLDLDDKGTATPPTPLLHHASSVINPSRDPNRAPPTRCAGTVAADTP